MALLNKYIYSIFCSRWTKGAKDVCAFERKSSSRHFGIENNEVLYEISYRIAGNIIKEKIVDIEGSGRGDFYCAHNPYPYGAPNFPTPHFDLEFWVRLPR